MRERLDALDALDAKAPHIRPHRPPPAGRTPCAAPCLPPISAPRRFAPRSTSAASPCHLHPADALRCLPGTDIDWLAFGNCFLRKAEQVPSLKREYVGSLEPD